MGIKKIISGKDKIELQWVRKKRIIGLLMMVFFPIIVGGLSKFIGPSKVVILFIAVTYFTSMMFILLTVNFYKCPRCKNFFFFTTYFANGFTSKCLHCGLNFKGE